MHQDFERGTAVGEFVGLVTTGIEGQDVIMGGSQGQTYQIFQGQMGQSDSPVCNCCKSMIANC